MTDNTMDKGQQEKLWQTIRWIKKTGKTMTDNTIAKGQKEKQWQTTQWLKDNRKNYDRQYNG